MAGTAAAQENRAANDTESSDVTVGVSETIAVDVQPANLDYPGAVVGNRNTTSDRGFGSIEISNTGSVYINRVWLNTSVPNSNPYGTGSASNYNAGNFLEARPTSDLPESGNLDTTNWFFVNRKEFMWSSAVGNVPSFIQVPSGWNGYHVSPLRRGNETLYMAIDSDGSNVCDGTSSATVRVGNVSSTDSRLGTVDFTSSSEYGWTEYTVQQTTQTDGSTSYGVVPSADLNWTYTQGSSELPYDVLTHCGGDSSANTVRTKYNPTAEQADDLVGGNGAAVNYLVNDQTTGGNMLAPGDMVTVNTAINVPQGVAAGSVSPGTLRVLITADPDQGTS